MYNFEERVGFEPTVAVNHFSFQDWRLKPLGHLSMEPKVRFELTVGFYPASLQNWSSRPLRDFGVKSLLPFRNRLEVLCFEVLPQFLKFGVSAWQLGHNTLRFSFVLFVWSPSMWSISKIDRPLSRVLLNPHWEQEWLDSWKSLSLLFFSPNFSKGIADQSTFVYPLVALPLLRFIAS